MTPQSRQQVDCNLISLDYTFDLAANITTWNQQVGANPAKLYTLGYDSVDQLTTANITGPNPLPIPNRFAYGYDKAGNRTAEQLDDAVVGATFNTKNQLMSRQPGGTLLFRGTLNEPATLTVGGKPAQVAAGNTFQGTAALPSGTSTVAIVATDPSGNVRTNTYQVTASGATTNYTHDANGNMSGDGTRTFEWDAENRLTAVKQEGTTIASFAYDGLGRRAQKVAGGVTTSYVYDDESVIEERLSTGAILRYVRGPALADQHWAMRDGSGTVTYFLADHLGSVVQTTNAAGQVTLAREYDPYGNPLSGGSQSGYAYTGREWDAEIQAYYYRARFYDPRTANFISEDSVDFGDGKSRYAYVRGNPIKLNDPSGHAASGGKNCDRPPADCSGGNCPKWVWTEFFNLCRVESNNPDNWISQCLQIKCKRELELTCDSGACSAKGAPPAYTPCSDSVVVCPRNPIPVADPNDPPCWRRVLAHEMVVHSCHPGGPSVPNHHLNDPPSKRVRKGIKCP